MTIELTFCAFRCNFSITIVAILISKRNFDVCVHKWFHKTGAAVRIRLMISP